MRSFIVLIEVAILLGGVGGFQSWLSKVALRPRTQLSGRKTSGDSLIVGINKYSHDASICILDGKSGEILFAQAKERISAKKHDGGGVGKLLKLALKSVGGRLKDVELIVQNNHHFRVNPFEKRLPFASSINYVPSSYLDDYNLVPKAKCLEISHHLAHAWSGLSTAPFSEGLVVVMDGMGESYKAMIEDMRGIERFSGDYLHDLKLLKLYGTDNFIGQPVSLFPGSTYREAETAYLWNSRKSSIQPVFKRWSREQSPSELYNHGFENMESIGAVYSRLSSHILGDWNACGKIMGLSSWSNHKSKDAKDWYYPSKNKDEKESLSIGKEFHHRLEFMKGNPVKGTFTINWELLDSLQHINQFSPSKFDYFANLAASIQDNLNDVTIQMLQSLKEQTKAKNLVFVGGVALNSILNQKILESNLFEQVYVPSYPGDEGIAIGCAMYGFQRKREEELLKIDEEKATVKSQQILPVSTAANIQNEVKDHQCKSTEPCNDPQNCASKANQDQNVHCQSQDHDHDHDHGHDHSQEPDVVPFHQQNFSPFSGFQISSDMIESAIEDYQSYVVVDKFASSEQLIEDASQALAEGKVIAWFQGRSEFGQRALGHRSILGNPSIPSLRRFINEKIKFREWYRPLAPSVLSEHVSEWFELPTSLTGATKLNFSPFMSYTAKIKAEKVNQISSVCHIDQTARLQTVTRDPDNQLYYDLIEKFYQKTKIPMILNTSLNKKSQPIIETPLQAIQFLLSLQNNLNSLYINNYKISLKPFPFPEKKGEEEDEPSVQDRNIYVKGKLLYRSELTFIGNEAKAQRARIQDNLLLLDPFEHYDVSASTSDDEDNEKAMRELPSDLHLELLQLLQEIPNMDDGSDDGHDHDHSHEHGEDLGENDTNSSIEESESMSRESGITLDELWHYLIQLRQSSSSQEEDDDKNNSENVVITWSSVKEALKWLYYEGLVEFPSSNGNLNDKAGKEVDKKVSTTKIEVESNDEQREEKIDEAEDDALISDVSGLFPGVNIRDLRTLG